MASAIPTSTDSATVATRALASPPVDARGIRMTITAISHATIDFAAMGFVPLVTVLEGRLQLTAAQGAFLLLLGGVCSGAIQPLVAWLSDRFNTRIFAPLGLIIGAADLAMLGFVETWGQLVLVHAIATAGIGAYHPVGAAAMGKLAGRRRSMGVTIFFVAGMIGHVAGSYLAPAWVTGFGLKSLGWFMAIAMGMAGILSWAVLGVSHREDHHHDVAKAAASLDHLAARWSSIWTLYVINVLRFTVNGALFLLVIRWSELRVLEAAAATELNDALRQAASLVTGRYEAALIVGMGTGGLAAGMMSGRGHERMILLGTAMIGVPAVIAMPFLSTGAVAWAVAVVAGLGYASTVPVTLSLAQRLLPHRTSLASGLMLGGAWMVGAAGPWLAQRLLDAFGFNVAFMVIASLLGVSGMLSLALPGFLLREITE